MEFSFIWSRALRKSGGTRAAIENLQRTVSKALEFPITKFSGLHLATVLAGGALLVPKTQKKELSLSFFIRFALYSTDFFLGIGLTRSRPKTVCSAHKQSLAEHQNIGYTKNARC